MPLSEMNVALKAQEDAFTKESGMGALAAEALMHLRAGCSAIKTPGKKLVWSIGGKQLKTAIVRQLVNRGCLDIPELT